MAMMKHICDELHEFDTLDDILKLTKKAARRVADELGYSQTCKDEIESADMPDKVDMAMYNERRRQNARHSI